MLGKTLSVTVVSDAADDRALYLRDRPELAKFFRINGDSVESGDSYGDIVFKVCKLRDGCSILPGLREIRPQYVFIALGDDKANYSVAARCREDLAVRGIDCTVSYVCEGEPNSAKEARDFYPLYVNEDIKRSALYPEIERMAFNTYLVEEKDLNMDHGAVQAEFKKIYSHNSCTSRVLALKYKLYSMGIDLDLVTFEEAAALYRSELSEKENEKLKNKLIWIEHRRWVTEKLCLGWHRIQDLEECAGGLTKDEWRKRHVCIVRSRPDQKLASEFTGTTGCKKWDTASDSELAQLDELDRMSVELHRLFVKKAAEAKKQNLLAGGTIPGIQTLIEGHKPALVALQEWVVCLKDIWNGKTNTVPLYKRLRTTFLKSIDDLPADRKKPIRDYVRAFETAFYPILASVEYHNWKQDDGVFIDKIPFVLTYTTGVHLAIPLSTGDNNSVFKNLAAATMVAPAKITYLHLVEEKADITALQAAVPYMVNYMGKKHFRANVELVLVCLDKGASLAGEILEEEIIKLGAGRIKSVRSIVVEKLPHLSDVVALHFRRSRVEDPAFFVEKNKTRLCSLLEGLGFFDSFASYKFDSSTLSFSGVGDRDMLSYIQMSPYITVADILSFNGSSGQSSSQPEFFLDVEELWKKYHANSRTWKQLCSILGEYSDQKDVLFACNSNKKAKSLNRYRYVFPSTCANAVEKVIDFLKKYGILESTSHISVFNSELCAADLDDRLGNQKRYEKLFSLICARMVTEGLSYYFYEKSGEVIVTFDDLLVTDVQLPAEERKQLRGLMEFFQKKGYVIDLTFDPDGKASFVYASRQIKELLTKAGRMLEVYTYHKVKEQSGFDDVMCGVEINWGDSQAKNEFDCIITKGFNCLFVECKACPIIEQGYYFKLHELTKKFGINAKAVLVADTREEESKNTPGNDVQRERGDDMGVVTIWRSEDISNIGTALLSVIDDFVKKEK